MFMISLEYVFGWIMSIHPANVKPESYDTVLKYQDECNHVLFNHFILKARFLEEQNAELLKLDDEEQSERRNFQTTKDRLTDIRMRKAELRNRTFETWEMEQRQLSIPFETAEIVEPNQEEE